MTPFTDLMQQRYTTKQYDASRTISPELIAQLKTVLQLSPSSINSQPWKFCIVGDPELKAQLADASMFNKPKVINASHLVVFNVIRDPERFEKEIETYLPQGAVDYYRNFLKELPQVEIQAWLSRQVYLSLGVFLSACAAMGIDSTPMEGIDTAAYDAILNLGDYRSLVAVAIGYRNPEDANQPALRGKSRRALDEVVMEY